MGAVACTVPTVGLVCVLIPHISAGTYYATPENEWTAKALPYVPSWLRVTDEEAVSYFTRACRVGNPCPGVPGPNRL